MNEVKLFFYVMVLKIIIVRFSMIFMDYYKINYGKNELNSITMIVSIVVILILFRRNKLPEMDNTKCCKCKFTVSKEDFYCKNCGNAIDLLDILGQGDDDEN